MRKFLIGAAFAATVNLWGHANASTNLLVNGSFETGDFTGWTQSGNTGATGVVGTYGGVNPEDGSFQAAMGRLAPLASSAKPSLM